MNTRKITNKSSKNDLTKYLGNWSWLIIKCSILLVLITTLSPFNFSFEDFFLALKELLGVLTLGSQGQVYYWIY